MRKLSLVQSRTTCTKPHREIHFVACWKRICRECVSDYRQTRMVIFALQFKLAVASKWRPRWFKA